MADAVIKLSAPIDHFGAVDSVVLKEPRFGALQRIGRPRFAANTEGAWYWIEQNDIIARYVDQFLGLPDGSGGWKPADGGGGALADKMSLKDGIAVRDALFSFFRDAT